MKTISKKLQKELRKAPTMSMDELEEACASEFDMDEIEQELENETDDVQVGTIGKISNAIASKGEKFWEYMSDGKVVVGFMIGLLYICIGCAVNYGKTWKYIDD